MFNTNLFIKNLYQRELGTLEPRQFQSSIFEKSLETFEVDKYYSNETTNASITWFSLETIDYRYLLASKSNGSIVCFDLYRPDQNDLKLAFGRDEAHAYSISCVQWYPFDTGMFFTSGMDKQFKIWDANSLQVVDQYRYEEKIFSHHMSSLVSSNTKSLIALAFHNGHIGFVDLRSGSSNHFFKDHTHGKCVSVQWSPIDSHVLCSAGYDGRIVLWDVRSSRSYLTSFDYLCSTEKKQSKYSSSRRSNDAKAVAHTEPILGCSFVHGGTHLVSIGKDNCIRLWNVLNATNTLVNFGQTFTNSKSYESTIQISSTELSDNNYIFIPNGRGLNIYNVFDGELIKTCKGHFEPINCCLYHPVLNQLYTGSRDRNIITWSTNYGCVIEKNSKNKTSKANNKTPTNFSGFSLF